MNFCPNCGTKITKEDKFCPNCGNNLTNNNSSSSVKNNKQNEINVNISAPNAVKGGLNRDFKEGRILEYKKAIGLNPDISNVLIGQVAYMGRLSVFGPAAILTAKYFIMSFEESGIVMFGINNLGHFKNKNAFIPSDSIKKIEYHSGMLKKVMSIFYADTKIKLYVTSIIVGSPFQKTNVKNIDKIIQKYN